MYFTEYAHARVFSTRGKEYLKNFSEKYTPHSHRTGDDDFEILSKKIFTPHGRGGREVASRRILKFSLKKILHPMVAKVARSRVEGF